MNRVVLAAFALLAGHGCVAVDQTTTIGDERRLMSSTMGDMDMTTTPMAGPDDVTSAAARSGGLGTMLLALLTFLYVGSAAGAAVDESTTMADERRLMSSTVGDMDMTTTPMAAPDDVTSAAVRSGGLGTMLLALLTFQS